MIHWIPVADGLWIGPTGRPYRDEFAYVLAVSLDSPLTSDGLPHRHMLPPAPSADVATFFDATGAWLRSRWLTNRHVLVQSDAYLWAEVVVAALFIDMGATADEAILSLRKARPTALAESTFTDHLRAREVRHV